MRAPMRLILLCTILILSCPWAPYGIAQTLSPEQLAHQTPDAMPHSGALVGLSGGQTLWIAPVDNKIRVLGAQDYIIPRKDGFWRVRFDVKWAPPEGSPAEAIIGAVKNDPALLGVPLGYGRLWAVPLKKGMDAMAWPTEQSVTSVQAEDNQNESPMDATQGDGEEEDQKQYLSFLSPDYLSFYEEHTSGGRIRETERILNVTDPPGTAVRPTEQLLVHEVPAPKSNSTRDKDLIACIDPDGKEGFNEVAFLVQWAIGKYVDAWTSELTPYFHAYGPREAGQDPKVENEEGLKFMQRRQPHVGHWVVCWGSEGRFCKR